MILAAEFPWPEVALAWQARALEQAPAQGLAREKPPFGPSGWAGLKEWLILALPPREPVRKL